MKVFKNTVIMLVVIAALSACDKSEIVYGGEGEFCSCFNLEDINKTVPAVNEFLAGLPDNITLKTDDKSKEQIFKSLAEWLNSFNCNIYATVTNGTDMSIGRITATGVSVLVKDNETVRELNVKFFDFSKPYPYSQITGYYYNKQDAIYVKTTFTKIDQRFDFINSIGLDVRSINSGSYISSMPADSANLEYIENNLKAKPYIRDTGVTVYLDFRSPEIMVFVNLHDMHNREYQADWLETMKDFKLVERESERAIIFYIPEGTGKQWENKIMKYDFVRQAAPYYTQYDIALINQ